jgi:hypothetical protein
METPSWLTKKQLKVATALMNQGFHYCGNANNFCEPSFTIPVVDGWEIHFPPGECFIDLYCDDALFSKNLEHENLNFETELKSAKKLIRHICREWDRSRVNHVQLSLSLLK